MSDPASRARRRFNEARRAFNAAVRALQCAFATGTATLADRDRVLNAARLAFARQGLVPNCEPPRLERDDEAVVAAGRDVL